MTTAFVEHPCSKEEKQRLRKKFDKVVDARYAPKKMAEGDKLITKAGSKAEPKAESKPKAE